MPIHFNPDGIVSVDSVEEAIRFEQLRGSRATARKPKRSKQTKGAKRQGWEGFLAFLEGPENRTARKILALVQGAADGIDRHQLARQLETDVQVVTGTITGLGRKATACALEPNDIITKDQEGRYRPGKVLAQHKAPIP